MKTEIQQCDGCGTMENRDFGKILYSQDSWSELDLKVTQRIPNEELHWVLCSKCTEILESVLAKLGGRK